MLNANALAEWKVEAEKVIPKRIEFELNERDPEVDVKVEWYENSDGGQVEIYEKLVEGRSYAMGVDPNGGAQDDSGDWCVACVLDVDTGNQVAEYRSKVDPDLSIDQIEGLGIYYNRAFTGVEANSYGLPYVRALELRSTLPMYEREILDSKDPGKRNKMIGWVTTSKSRYELFKEMKRAVRLRECRVQSKMTLAEMGTLAVVRAPNSRLERIEARQGCHDDGPMAYGIALMMRNQCISPEYAGTTGTDTEDEDVNTTIEELMQGHGLSLKQSSSRLGWEDNRSHVFSGKQTINGRRDLV